MRLEPVEARGDPALDQVAQAGQGRRQHHAPHLGVDVVQEDDPRSAVPERARGRACRSRSRPGRRRSGAPCGCPPRPRRGRRRSGRTGAAPGSRPASGRAGAFGTAEVRKVTSSPAAAQREATLWACSSEPPASGSSRSRQATKWMRRRPASAAMEARTSGSTEPGVVGGPHRARPAPAPGRHPSGQVIPTTCPVSRTLWTTANPHTITSSTPPCTARSTKAVARGAPWTASTASGERDGTARRARRPPSAGRRPAGTWSARPRRSA